MLQKLSSRSLLILFACCVLPWLGSYDFFTRGEAREALVVQDIYLNGEWILPRGYDGAVASKPPLFHWIAATLSIPAGQLSELTIRMPSAIFSLLTVAVFIWLNSGRLREEGRILFSILLLFSLEWLRSTLTARVDMVHSATLACALMAGFEAGHRKSAALWRLSTVLVALSTVAKGPVALILSTGVLGGWYAILRRSRHDILRAGASIGGAALIAALWYLLAFEEAPQEFSNRFWYENFQRFAGTMREEPHQHSALYLIGVCLLGWLPWSAVFLAVSCLRFRKVRELLREAPWKKEPALVFALLSAGAILTFYSIPSSKRGVYLLSSYPFVALALALILQASSERFLGWLKMAAVAGCAAVFLGQAFVVPYFLAGKRSQRSLGASIEEKIAPGHNVFSYDEEFYGASYYGKRRYYRIPEPDERKEPVVDPAPGDLVVYLEHSRQEAERILAARGLGVRELGRIAFPKEVAIVNVLEGLE